MSWRWMPTGLVDQLPYPCLWLLVGTVTHDSNHEWLQRDSLCTGAVQHFQRQCYPVYHKLRLNLKLYDFHSLFIANVCELQALFNYFSCSAVAIATLVGGGSATMVTALTIAAHMVSATHVLCLAMLHTCGMPQRSTSRFYTKSGMSLKASGCNHIVVCIFLAIRSCVEQVTMVVVLQDGSAQHSLIAMHSTC